MEAAKLAKYSGSISIQFFFKKILQLLNSVGGKGMNLIFHDVPGILDWIEVRGVAWLIKNRDIVSCKETFDSQSLMSWSSVMHEMRTIMIIKKST